MNRLTDTVYVIENEYIRIYERIFADFLCNYASFLVDHFKLIYKY